MKKWVILIMTFLLVLAPLGLGSDDVEAKKFYKSGKKSFNPSISPKKSDGNLNSKTTKDSVSTQKGTSTTANRGGIMRGMLYGGLAGLLFGSMFNGLGAFGAILGFLVNLMAIFALIAIILAGFAYFKNSRRKQEASGWKR